MSKKCHELGCSLAAAETESGQIHFCEQHARERGYQLLRCPKCGFMDWLRGDHENICGICLAESSQDVPLEVVTGSLPTVQGARVTPRTFLGWKYARSKRDFVEGEVLLVATHPRNSSAKNSSAPIWQVDSVLVCYEKGGEVPALKRHDGNYCEFKWNEVAWYINLKDLQPTLHSLPAPRYSAPDI